MPHRSVRYSRIHHTKHSESSEVDSSSNNANNYQTNGAINPPQFGWRYDHEDLSERWWEKPVYIHTYIILFIDLVFGIFYLSYIALMMTERTLNWDYTIILEFQERNTWSLIGPWLLIILSILVSFKLYTKGRIRDGDFQGILGWYILVAIIVFMEGFTLYETSDRISKEKRNESLYEDLQVYMINGTIEAKEMGAIYNLPNWLQEDYQCCGVKDHNDWLEMDEEPPDSCGCKKADGPNCHQPDGFGTKYIWKRGCADVLWDRLGPIYFFIAALHFTCAALLIYNSFVFVCLFKPMKMWEKRKKGPSTERIIGQPRDLLKLRKSEIPGRRPSSHELKKIHLREKARLAASMSNSKHSRKSRSKSSKASGMKSDEKFARTEDVLIDIGPRKESFIHYFPPSKEEDDEDLLRLVSKQGKQHQPHHLPHPHMPHLHKRKQSTDSQRSNKSNKSKKSLDAAYKNLGNYKKDEKAWSYTSLNKNVGKNQRNFFESLDENGDPIKSKDKNKRRKSSLDEDADKIDRIDEPKKKRPKKDPVIPIPPKEHKKQNKKNSAESQSEKVKTIKKHSEKVEDPKSSKSRKKTSGDSQKSLGGEKSSRKVASGPKKTSGEGQKSLGDEKSSRKVASGPKRTSGESQKSPGDEKSSRKVASGPKKSSGEGQKSIGDEKSNRKLATSPKRKPSEGGKSLGKGAKDDGLAIHKEKGQIGDKGIPLHKEPGKIGHKHHHTRQTLEKEKAKAAGSPRGKSEAAAAAGADGNKAKSQSPRRTSPAPGSKSRRGSSSGKSLSPSEKSDVHSILKHPTPTESQKSIPPEKKVHFS